MTPEGTLIIRKAIPKDAGVYGCLASNSAGTEKQTSTLTYIGKREKQYCEIKKIIREEELLKLVELCRTYW